MCTIIQHTYTHIRNKNMVGFAAYTNKYHSRLDEAPFYRRTSGPDQLKVFAQQATLKGRRESARLRDARFSKSNEFNPDLYIRRMRERKISLLASKNNPHALVDMQLSGTMRRMRASNGAMFKQKPIPKPNSKRTTAPTPRTSTGSSGRDRKRRSDSSPQQPSGAGRRGNPSVPSTGSSGGDRKRRSDSSPQQPSGAGRRGNPSVPSTGNRRNRRDGSGPEQPSGARRRGNPSVPFSGIRRRRERDSFERDQPERKKRPVSTISGEKRNRPGSSINPANQPAIGTAFIKRRRIMGG